MKLKYRLSLIVIAVLIIAVALISIALLRRASSMQMAESLQSQERLAAEQARVIQMRYEGYLRVVKVLAGLMADFAATAPGQQRGRFTQILRSTLQTEGRISS